MSTRSRSPWSQEMMDLAAEVLQDLRRENLDTFSPYHYRCDACDYTTTVYIGGTVRYHALRGQGPLGRCPRCGVPGPQARSPQLPR